MPGWVKVLLVVIVFPIIIGLVVLLFAGRPVAFEVLQRRTAARFPDVKWISTEDLGRWQSDSGQPQPVVLDARTDPEYAVSHLPNAIAIDPYKPNLRALGPAPKTGPIVVYSSAGYRGARVGEWLRNMGYTSVVNLAGGIFKWANEGRPLFRQDGRPAALVHPYDQRWGMLLDGRYKAQAADVAKQSAAP